MTDARRILAVLGNDRARTLFARLVLGERVHPANAKERRALQSLIDAGVVSADLAVTAAPFDLVLEALPRPEVRRGIDRFIVDGRIVQYPVNPEARLEVLEWVVAQALTPEEVLDERQLGERLARHTDDIAVLRRYLVDAGLLLRTRSGSSYGRAPGE